MDKTYQDLLDRVAPQGDSQKSIEQILAALQDPGSVTTIELDGTDVLDSMDDFEER